MLFGSERALIIGPRFWSREAVKIGLSDSDGKCFTRLLNKEMHTGIATVSVHVISRACTCEDSSAEA